MKIGQYLSVVIRWLLLGTALIPLLVSNFTIYPFVFPKIVFYRVLVELSLVLSFIYIAILPRQDLKKIFSDFDVFFRRAIKNSLTVFLVLFFISLIVSTLFADNTYRAFWGDIERGVGVFGFLHFFAFLILSLIFFSKKEWETYIRISVFVGLLLLVYVYLEYFGIRFLFLAPAQKTRPESFIGNAAFLATHLIILATFTGVLFNKYLQELKTERTLTNYFWVCLYSLVFVLSLITVFITGTRGAILGVGFGLFALLIYFAVRKGEHKLLRAVSVIAIITALLFVSVFWITRSNEIWQKIPGFDRFAKTAALDANDPSTQFRLITWKLSFEAFKERPLFGWGPENYINAYEKYYDPTYALYGETWLDRAHNTFFDLLVMQGIFGVISYYGFIIVLLYLVFKKMGKIRENFYLSGILGAGIIAYVIQNLFIFDQIVSYATFFALVGYIICSQNENNTFTSYHSVGYIKSRYLVIYKVVLLLATFAIIYSIYSYNLYPYYQGMLFKNSPGVSGNAYEVEAAIKKAISPYNFAQYNIRSQGIDTIYMGQYFDNETYVNNQKYRPLGFTLINMIVEIVDKEPYDVRTSIRLVEMLTGFSVGLSEKEISDIKIYEKTEQLLRSALKRAPNRQELYYQLAFNLAIQKKYDDAIKTAQQGIDLEPKVARAHYHMALVLALAGKNEESQKSLAKIEELSPKFEGFLGNDIGNIATFYKKFGLLDKFADIAYRTLSKNQTNYIGYFVLPKEDYEATLRYYVLNKNAERALVVATYLRDTFLDLKDEMNSVINLIEKKEWNKLNNVGQEKVITIALSREYFENELRKNIINKDKENAIKAAQYLLTNYREYSLGMGIDTIFDLLQKENWDILMRL
ncbi:MAG: O-antigen ligase family protein [bacterium]|nr:O-antigen ligase family protein [bacterium]